MMCLVLLGGVWEHIVKWRTHMFTVFTPFFTLGPGSTTLYSTNALSHGLISSTTFLQHSTTLYSLQHFTALQQFYSLQPLQHPKLLCLEIRKASCRQMTWRTTRPPQEGSLEDADLTDEEDTYDW